MLSQFYMQTLPFASGQYMFVEMFSQFYWQSPVVSRQAHVLHVCRDAASAVPTDSCLLFQSKYYMFVEVLSQLFWLMVACYFRTSTICDPTTWNKLHWYLRIIQNTAIFDLQVKNIDFWCSSKSGASGIILFENITLNGQMWCFMTVSGILNCKRCNTVVCETNFLSPVSQRELSTVARLIYQ